MKLLLAIVWLGCISYVSAGGSNVHKIEDLLKENTKQLGDTKILMGHIDATNKLIKEGVEEQQVWVSAIKNVDVLLTKLNLFMDVQSVVVLEALKNITHKSGQYTERLSKELLGLAKLQLSTKQQIVNLEQKMEAYQKHVLRNARSIDNNILDLTKLITRAVLPQLNGLQCSFDSLETSHINVEVELKGLERIKDISEDSNIKLNILGEQLRSLNRTQQASLSVLSSAVKHLEPLSSWQIVSALRELIISQKRIELDLEACQKHRISAGPASYGQSYEPQPTKVHARTQAGKQVDLVQAWSIKQPSQQSASSSSYYASAYASAPQPKPKPAEPSNPDYNNYGSSQARPNPSYSNYGSSPAKPNPRYSNYGSSPAKPNPEHSVSWQQPLPWENYGSVALPAPEPKPKQSGPGRKRPAPNPKPCPQEQYQEQPLNPSHYAPAASYGPQSSPSESYAHQYQQKGSKPGQAISWYSVDAKTARY